MDGALRVATARGDVSVLSPDAYKSRFGVAPTGGEKPHFAAFRIAVADRGRAEAVLRDNGIAFRSSGDSLFIDPADCFGVLLEFAPLG